MVNFSSYNLGSVGTFFETLGKCEIKADYPNDDVCGALNSAIVTITTIANRQMQNLSGAFNEASTVLLNNTTAFTDLVAANPYNTAVGVTALAVGAYGLHVIHNMQKQIAALNEMQKQIAALNEEVNELTLNQDLDLGTQIIKMDLLAGAQEFNTKILSNELKKVQGNQQILSKDIQSIKTGSNQLAKDLYSRIDNLTRRIDSISGSSQALVERS